MRELRDHLFGVTLLIVAVGIGAVACRGTRESSEPSALGGATESEPAGVEDSGRTLNGTYALKTVRDDYSKRGDSRIGQLKLSFYDDGRFEKQEASDGKLRSLEGTYVIGTHNELVLYVERVNSQPLDAARIERYVMDTTGDSGLLLRYDSGGMITLEKQ
ncbi:MAG TPA: hypothetical protein VEZ90_02605 [Blastocatellia bacterium]|nr:hypothetical protein [Blastocatellia bacterium]